MSDTGGFAGMSLLDLFKMEAESHCAVLSSGLLALEKSPTDGSVVEPLMRAAHSIKGAAKIVGLDVIVSLAHVMEECFLAAKGGREMLTSARVDQLLKGVDVLAEIRELAESDLPGWTQSQAGRIAALVAELKAAPPTAPPIVAATVAAVAVAATPSLPAAVVPVPEDVPDVRVAAEPANLRAAPASSVAQSVSGSVRVASGVLNRLLFLAGESTVQASRMQSLHTLMVGLRARDRELDIALQSLGEAIAQENRRAGGGEVGTGRRAQKPRFDLPLAEVAAAADRVSSTIIQQASSFEETFRRVEELSGALYSEVLKSRMRPFSEGVSAFPRMVRDISRQLGKDVEIRIEGESVEVDREILQKLESPLTHMIRNSLDHGIELPADRQAAGKPPRATITLAARHQSGMLVIQLRDDGRGIDPEAIRRKIVERRMVDPATAERLTLDELMEFPFLPGFSTKEAVTEISGRGVGLDVVQSMVREVSGSVTLDSEAGRGARFTMRLPVTRSVIRAALIRAGGQLFAVPLARLHRVLLVPRSEVIPVQGRLQFSHENQSIGLIPASDLLGGTPPPSADDPVAVLVIGGGTDDSCGLMVDRVCGEEDLVVRPLDSRLGSVPHIASVAIRADGIPVFVVDVDDLARSIRQALAEGRPLGVAPQRGTTLRQARRRILVVDDSITVREVERQLLLRRGYEVDVAVDGKEGFNALRAKHYDLLVTDVDMPRMTGIELIRAVRLEPKLVDLPIIIVSYKDREEDRMKGLEVGATAYLTKSSFHDDSLIRMVHDLIGAPS